MTALGDEKLLLFGNTVDPGLHLTGHGLVFMSSEPIIPGLLGY
jgi:hypothetical protein